MDADTVLADLAHRGVVLFPEGENLRAHGTLTDADRTAIRRHKPALLAALLRRPVTLPPSIEGIPLDAIRRWAGADWPALASDPAALAAYVQAAIEAGELAPPPPNDWGLAKPRGGLQPPFVAPHGEVVDHPPGDPDRQPLPPTAVAARDAFHSHLATCGHCWAPATRYCAEGLSLRSAYRAALGGEA